MVERKDSPNGCNNNSMPGVGEGVRPGADHLKFWWLFPSGGIQICPIILEKINSVFIKQAVQCYSFQLPSHYCRWLQKKHDSRCKSLLNAPASDIRLFVLLDRLGHTSCNLCVCDLFNRLLSHVVKPHCLQWVSSSL